MNFLLLLKAKMLIILGENLKIPAIVQRLAEQPDDSAFWSLAGIKGQ